MQWFIDGQLCRRQGNTADVQFLTKKQNLIMNFWTPTFPGWEDNFSDADMPWYTRYDFVKVETYNEATGGFDFHWQDNFDSFDFNRWVKSEGWGFQDNSSTFYGSQVYTENGALVLKMEHPWNSAEDTPEAITQ